MKTQNNIPALRFSEFDGEWETIKLGKLSERIGDGLHGTPIYSDESDIYFINGNNLINGRIEITEKTKKVDYSIFKKNDKGLNENTILISLNGTIGNISKYNNEKVMLGKSVGYFKFKENTDFYFHVFHTNKIQNYFISELTGSTIKNLSLKTLRETNFPSTSLPEQQKIASFLSAVDEKIQQLTRKATLLEQYKKGIMQQLFSGALRFKDEDGKDFPEWEKVNGNVLFESISNKNHNSDLPILAITQDQGAIPRDLIDYNISVTEKSVDSYKVVEVGDFVISLRSFQGGIEYSSYKGICSPAYIILRPTSENVDKVFYRYYLKTSSYIKELQKNLEGIRDGKMISYKYFSDIKLPFPCLKEQQKIASFLSGIDGKIASVNAQLEKTQTFKKGLLQQMFV